VATEGSGDAGMAGQPQDGEGEVSQGGHDTRAAGGADLRTVLVVVHVADPVQAVLDHPVAAGDGRELGRAGLDSLSDVIAEIVSRDTSSFRRAGGGRSGWQTEFSTGPLWLEDRDGSPRSTRGPVPFSRRHAAPWPSLTWPPHP
jgi:hypothetical protein